MNTNPRRIVAYGRVSRVQGREGDSYASPEIQEQAIRRWAEYHGAEVVGDFLLDEDVSGSTKAKDRPGLSKAFQMIEAGEADGLAVVKLNRFSRSTTAALRDLEHLEELGAQFVSVEEDFDTVTPFGRFALTMLLAVATLERDNIVAGWKVAKTRALKRGAWVGPTPFGYARDEDATLALHPEHADMLREAYRLARHTVEDARDYLNSLGLVWEDGRRKGKVRHWTSFTVRRLLANPAYYTGRLTWTEKGKDERVHAVEVEAIVDEPTWRLAQHEAIETRSAPATFPLSGLMSCATCGGSMIGGRGGKNLRTYRCANSLASAKRKGTACPAPATMVADGLEAYVDGVLRAWADDFGAVVDSVAGDPRVAQEALKRAQEANRNVEAYVQKVPPATPGFEDGLAGWKQQADDAWEAYRKLAQADDARVRVVSGHDRINDMSHDEWAAMVADMAELITVARGRGPVESRVVVTIRPEWRGEAPVPKDAVGSIVGEEPPAPTDADVPEWVA
jgi:DNA invertase Pin-like site-specific DNA recombinase